MSKPRTVEVLGGYPNRFFSEECKFYPYSFVDVCKQHRCDLTDSYIFFYSKARLHVKKNKLGSLLQNLYQVFNTKLLFTHP